MSARIGRPPTERGAYNPIPTRMLGRVDQATWDRLKAAAKAAGKPFSTWAVEALREAAKKQQTKK